MQKRLSTLIGSILLIGFTSLSFVGTSMSAETGASKATRQVNTLDLNKNHIILDDRMYAFTSSTMVYRANGTQGGVNDLRPGMRVIIQALPPSGASTIPVLTAIRILP